jgi:TonB-linked SusC/RagA family outer membrane protein
MYAKNCYLQLMESLRLLLILLSVFACSSLQAQQPVRKLVRAIVFDENNQTLVGVHVRVKEELKRATVTDREGKFNIRASDSETLLFSFVGYDNLQVKVSAIKGGAIKLKPSLESLNEVVVIGYGSVKRKDITGSVSEVKIEDMNKAPVSSFDEALAGRIPGVQVSSNSGQPGDDINIVIRGGNSITQSNAPLYVVDGFPLEDFNPNSLNQDDIESISVLKDASATAIYGTRGANGVIIIETKKGKIGKPVVSYNGFIGINQATKKMDLMNPYDFVRYQLDRDYNNMSTIYLTKPNLTLEDYKNAEPIDWQDKIFRDAFNQNHSLSLRGGNEQTRYSFSGGIVNQDGVIINSGFNRKQMRATVTQTINPKLKASFNVSYSKDDNFGQTVASPASTANSYATYLMYRVWSYRPLNTNSEVDIEEELFDDDVSTTSVLAMNPVISTKNEVRQQSKTIFTFNSGVAYDFLKNFKLDIRGSYASRLTRNEAFNNSKTYRGFPSPNNMNGVNGSFNDLKLNDWASENTLTYKNRIDKNNEFNVMVGATAQGSKVDNYGFVSVKIPHEELGLRALELGIPNKVTSSASSNSLVSFLGRTNYTYKSKYLFTVSFRADASSKFAKQNRWAYFPSGAFAWQMGREGFMKKLNFVSDSKLRVSYGITGNNRINDFTRLMTLDIGDYYSANGETPEYAIVIDNLGNEDIKWEKTSQADIGYELSLFNNRVNFVIDYYQKVTRDLLLNANIPSSSGFNKVIKNIGKVQNTGLEMSLSTTNIKTRNFSWISDFNISFNRNKVLALTEGESSLLSTVSFSTDYNGTSLYLAKVGMPVASFYGVVWDGNYQYEDFDQKSDGSYVLKPTIPTNGNDASTIQPGDIKYVDQNGDGTVNEKDQVIIGRGLPIHFGGFNNNFKYKNLSLNVFFQWSYGNDIMNANRLNLEGNPADRHFNQFATYNDRWTTENQSNKYFRIDGSGPKGVYSTRTLEDGSFLRLKTVQLSYTFPKKMIHGLSGLDVYVSGQNLYTWTNYSGLDPEVSTKNSILTPGFDYSAYARNRILTFGLKLVL